MLDTKEENPVCSLELEYEMAAAMDGDMSLAASLRPIFEQYNSDPAAARIHSEEELQALELSEALGSKAIEGTATNDEIAGSILETIGSHESAAMEKAEQVSYARDLDRQVEEIEREFPVDQLTIYLGIDVVDYAVLDSEAKLHALTNAIINRTIFLKTLNLVGGSVDPDRLSYSKVVSIIDTVRREKLSNDTKS